METFFIITLFLFGLLFGSFSSVIIHRIKAGEGGIMTGRSHCGSCNKLLQAIDLIPIFSWLFTGGKCRQCSAKVSAIYPILELSTGLLFAAVGYFLINFDLILGGNFLEITKLFFWLLISFISIIYFFYDLLFLEISERVLAVGVITASIFIWLATAIPGLFDTTNFATNWMQFSNGDSSLILQSTLLLIILGGLYTIILKGLSEIWDSIILIGLWGAMLLVNYYIGGESNGLFESPIVNGLFGALSIFTFFFIQIVVSGGRWMGQGDLRIAIFVGLLLGTTLAFPAMMITYMVGSVIGVGMIVYQRLSKKGAGDFNSQIPFGPFIAMGFFIAVFFNELILDFMDKWLYI